MMIFTLLMTVVLSWSQTDITTDKTNPQKTEESIDKSFQREFIYLHSQKEALLKHKAKMDQTLSEKIRSAKAQTLQMQKDNVQLSADNDDRHEELIDLDRRKKELQKRGTSLESTYKKAQISLTEYAAGLRFESNKEKPTVHIPEDLSLAHFDEIMSKAQSALESSTQVEVFSGAFLNSDNKVVSGEITRFGRVAAIGSIDQSHYVLGPSGEGLLKALEPSSAPTEPLLNLYVFQSLTKTALIKKQGTLVEKVADLSPIIFLSLILLLIAGLFTSLLKV